MTGNAIEIRELTRRYPRMGRPDLYALDRVFLAVAPGEVRGLLSPNGAGKTTLCRILSSVLLSSAGRGGGVPRGWRVRRGTGSSSCRASDVTVWAT
ncbi:MULTISPECIES: ATP-binding cassette domain-containing protein [unclassified Streptomyces]|uniref:ATP-binding cassette domain-containing protein n=1 Tax=unclassified Streptomyces TaxID=2593676 RepID=UPI0023671F01|nr:MULTISPECIES: ATP-binding cassette domain-containing protein [unclassified Streptomyces]MDF3144725.1 ATP-binding cassette domain-containing protein [Streptomyces sp. T21Q-yed]WDF36049.1 ATP-binding cassette domain-containing protein [Streptomyces sp. T12]